MRHIAPRLGPWASVLLCHVLCFVLFVSSPPARRGYPREEGGGWELEAEAARIKHEKPRKIETERDTAK